MSKPSTPKATLPVRSFSRTSLSRISIFAISICVIAVIAAATLLAARPARSGRHANVAATAQSKPQSITPAARARINASYAALPLAFEENQGQTDPQVKYMARGNGYKLLLTSSQAILSLPARRRTSAVRDIMLNKRRGAAAVKAMIRKRELDRARGTSVAVVKMNLLGASPRTQLAAADLQPGKVNYFLGHDPSKWHSNVPLYGRVNYRGVYPGIDLAFHGAAQRLEFDYVVNPGADAAPIALGFQGATSIHTTDAGDLVLATAAGPVQLDRPVAYQVKNGRREVVDARFFLRADNEVTFKLGSYDHDRELVIDPTVTYSTYFGGDFADYGISIAADASGNSYVAGATDSDTIPAASGSTVAPNDGGFDSFVTKIDSTGACVFTTFFGGSSDEFPGGIAIDGAGIYIAGTTDSSDFPATVGQTVFLGGTTTNGGNDAYAVKLALNGSFAWGTYIAGSDSDSGLGVAVDPSSHTVYVVGETFSNDLGGTTGGVNHLPNGGSVNLGQSTGADDGYIVKLSSGGTTYDLVSYIGGSSGDLATGVALDGSGNIYVAGETISTDLPVTGSAVQGQCGTDGTCNAGAQGALDDMFVVAIKSNLSAYNYVTYYGGSNVDDAFAIAADTSGDAFVTGTTASSNFPTAGAPYQASLAGTQNAFLLKLNPSGSAATYSTYFGGNGSDFGLAIALDGSGNAYLTGQTTSSQTGSGKFPLLNPKQTALSGTSDAFVSVLGLSQGQLLFSTYLGGGADEDTLEGGIALDSTDNIYVTGDTDSGNGSTAAFPTTAALDGTFGGGACTDSNNASVPCPDAFITAYSPATAADFTIAAAALSPATVAPGSSATSTVTVSSLSSYTGTVTLTCAVTGGGSPAPQCSVSPASVSPTNANPATPTLTVTTTGSTASLFRPSSIFYAAWLPVVGLSLIGMRFSTSGSRRKKLFGFLLIGMVMAALFLLPACGGSSGGGGGGGGCTGCTPAGTYSVTVTGTDGTNTHASNAVTLTVN